MMNIEITLDLGKVVTSHINGFTIKTDQPLHLGGENSAPTPFDLFLASLGTCAGIHVKLFCDQRNILTDKIKILLSVEYDSILGIPAYIKMEIQLPADFPEKYKNPLIHAANLCKVKKSICNPPDFEIITTESTDKE